MKKYKAIPTGKHRVLYMGYLTKNTLEIKRDKVGEMLNTNQLDVVVKEATDNIGWGVCVEDIYWNDKHNCIEIEMGT
jgi:hypothetical protein